MSAEISSELNHHAGHSAVAASAAATTTAKTTHTSTNLQLPLSAVSSAGSSPLASPHSASSNSSTPGSSPTHRSIVLNSRPQRPVHARSQSSSAAIFPSSSPLLHQNHHSQRTPRTNSNSNSLRQYGTPSPPPLLSSLISQNSGSPSPPPLSSLTWPCSARVQAAQVLLLLRPLERGVLLPARRRVPSK